ncbi:choice-of-anchor D domain-containing protein [Dyadobacter sp. CY347]|uniref:choice-of-anchor D domain-containing protein n=1 Tax=Dyadobacter sp. CY347 TaxID=2909336 RepID=UPI001F21F570|nr:choice-of-anchor D domain-containing protein [Dyadobacter sp. CY347]MCF2486755.1 choice-of-anchor D domain-containing protein [Dyadobacter sp. CY347]
MNKISTFCKQCSLFLLIILCAFSAPLFAQQVTWTGNVDSDWATAENWSAGLVPTSVDDVVIPAAANRPAINGTAVQVNTIEVLSGGILHIAAGGILTAAGQKAFNGADVASLYNLGVVENNGKVTLGSTAEPATNGLWNNGNFSNNACATLLVRNNLHVGVWASMDNKGLIAVQQSFKVRGTFTNKGALVNEKFPDNLLQYSNGDFLLIYNNSNTIFGAGYRFNGTLIGIFKDQEGTQSAGNFVSQYDFTPENLPIGTQTLYAKFTLSEGSCEYLAPFSYQYIVSPTIEVSANGVRIENGSATPSTENVTDFGSHDVGVGSRQESYLIENIGREELLLTGAPTVALTGSTDFTITRQPGGSLVYGTGDNVDIRFRPMSAGVKTAVVSIASNDPSQNPFTFTLRGEGNATECTPTETPDGLITWIGLESDDWNTPCNWSPASVPGAGNNVLILGGATHSPAIPAGTNTSVFHLEIESNATLQISEQATLAIVGRAGGQGGHALSNSGTLENRGKLLIGNAGFVGEGLINIGDLQNYSTGEIEIDAATRQFFTNYGTVINAGKITTGAGALSANYTRFLSNGIHNEATFNNTASGILIIENNGRIGLVNTSNFTNEGIIRIGVNGGVRVGAGNYGGNFSNRSGASMSIDGFTTTGLENAAGTFNNAGVATIGGSRSTGGNGITNDDTFNNEACGKIDLLSGTFVNNAEKTVTNAGLIRIVGKLENAGIFDDKGALVIGTFSGTDVVHHHGNFLWINNNSSMIFGPGFNFQGTLMGIFKDQEGTQSAGTFVSQNDFTPENLPVGAQTLYAKFTLSPGSCEYIAPFSYEYFLDPTIKVTADGVRIENGSDTPSTENFTDFGSHEIGIGSRQQQYNIENIGREELLLTGTPAVTLTGSTDFAITRQLGETVPYGGIEGLEIRFRPMSAGVKTAVVSIASNDPSQNPFTFTLRGEGNATECTPTETPDGLITWIGQESSDWNTPCNWSPASVPGAGNNVLILGGATHSPVIPAGTNTSVFYLEIESNATLQISEQATLAIVGRAGGQGGHALSNSGSLENRGKLLIGNAGFVGEGLINIGDLQNYSTGEIEIDAATRQFFTNYGTVTNAGKITTGAGALSTNYTRFLSNGIHNEATFNNTASGILIIENNGRIGLVNTSNFTNEGIIWIGVNGGVRVGAGNYGGNFSNRSGASMSIDGFSTTGLENAAGTFNNAGVVTIGGSRSTGGNGITNDDTFNNEACGTVTVLSGTFVNNAEKTTTNTGLIRIVGNLENAGIFTNYGVFKYKENTGSESVSNNTDASVIVNDGPAAKIFTFGGTYNGTISGIYKDENATLPAGTITTATNTFLPKDLTAEIHALYVKIIPAGSACEYIVPFQFDNTASLPVTLVSFSGKKSAENENTLKWVTSDEKNFDRFEVQSSADARSFQTIGNVTGSESQSTSFSEYQFVDQNIWSTSYYRLKMIDKDATFSYSKVIVVSDHGSAEEISVVGKIYPNPSIGDVFVDVMAVKPETWHITILDVTGRIIFTENRDLQTGINKIKLQTPSSGLNLIKFENGKESVVRKLVKE